MTSLVMDDETKQPPKDCTVSDLLDYIAGEICENYCKYPEQYGKREYKLFEEKCSHCPLNLL